MTTWACKSEEVTVDAPTAAPVLPSQAQTGRCLQASTTAPYPRVTSWKSSSIRQFASRWTAETQILPSCGFCLPYIPAHFCWNATWALLRNDLSAQRRNSSITPSNQRFSLAYSSHYHEPSILLIVRIRAQHWAGTVFIPDLASPQAEQSLKSSLKQLFIKCTYYNLCIYFFI